MWIIPDRTRETTSKAALRSREMTPPVSPYSVSLAMSMAASVESTGWMTVAGPKISEAKMSMSVVTSVSTTGLMSVPFGPSIAPSPVSRLARLVAASLTSFEIRCAPRVLMRGPTIVAGSAPATPQLRAAPPRDDPGFLPPESDPRRLAMLSGLDPDDAPDVGRAREVDHPHSRVGDEGSAHVAGIGQVVGDDIKDPGREPSFGQDVGQQKPARDRRILARLHHSGVANGQRNGDGSGAH